MQIRTMAIEALKPAEYNPRQVLRKGSKDYERLARSIREFALVQPLVWNVRTGHVVGGHQRLAILKDQGITEVQVVEVDLPLEREKALNVALNNSRIGSDWDLEKLEVVLSELSELPELDLTMTGFSEQDLRDLRLTPVEERLIEEPTVGEHSIEVELIVERQRWSEVEPMLNRLIAEQGVQVHLKQNAPPRRPQKRRG